MTIIVLDVENTVTERNGKLHMDPFEPENTLTMIGLRSLDNSVRLLLPFDHAEDYDNQSKNAAAVQDVLDKCTLLVGHNLKHDLMWLWESGFKYDGPIYDTMLGEYILLRGLDGLLALGAIAERRCLKHQKSDILKTYFKQGYTTRTIPLKLLTEYLGYDIDTTADLYNEHMVDYAKPESVSLHKVRDLTMETCVTLTRMYCNGFMVDRDALQEVKKQYEEELIEIEKRLHEQVRRFMGDTPINLNSPEQMSQVIFSRKVKDKKEWAELFQHARTPADFKKTVIANSTVIRKTVAKCCPDCDGDKLVYRVKKDGKPFAKPSKCKTCDGNGYLLHNTDEVAGLKFFPPSKEWVTVNGFSTSKDNLSVLIGVAKQNNMTDAVNFLTDLQRLSAVSSYLSSFVGGIEHFAKENNLLHVALTQHITATGRFSGRDPNMQNMPRGKTFPVKRAFISRFKGGKVMEADFAQLEFRVAAFLSQDSLAMQEIESKFDVHSYTSKVITEAGEPTSRQEAKPHTFAPLYGATGYGRTPAQEAYYIAFIKKYEGIAGWHSNLAEEALRFEKITIPSGRQYAFPGVRRRKNGGVTDFTRIKNYPVQGFATGDIVPAVLVEIERRMRARNMLSLLVNTVHDSIVLDVHPDEEQACVDLIAEVNADIHNIIFDRFGIVFNVPLLLEAKMGPNWLDTVEVS